MSRQVQQLWRISLTVVSMVMIYFCHPEMKQKSLEELAVYFGESVMTNEDLVHDMELGTMG